MLRDKTNPQQTEEIKQASEIGSDVADILELSDWGFNHDRAL